MVVTELSWRLEVLICAMGFALASGPGLAATVSTCTSFEPEIVGGVRLRFPYEPFDPRLGRLDQAVVSVQGRVFGQAFIADPTGGPAYAFAITHELATDLGRSFTFFAGEIARFEFSGTASPLIPFGYSRDFSYQFTCGAMSNLDAFCPLDATLGVDNALTGMSARLDGFTDDGLSVPWQVFVNTDFVGTGSEVPFTISPDPLLGAEGATCVDYSYTPVPEPAESLGFLAALLTLGGLSRVRAIRVVRTVPSSRAHRLEIVERIRMP